MALTFLLGYAKPNILTLWKFYGSFDKFQIDYKEVVVLNSNL